MHLLEQLLKHWCQCMLHQRNELRLSKSQQTWYSSIRDLVEWLPEKKEENELPHWGWWSAVAVETSLASVKSSLSVIPLFLTLRLRSNINEFILTKLLLHWTSSEDVEQEDTSIAGLKQALISKEPLETALGSGCSSLNVYFWDSRFLPALNSVSPDVLRPPWW